MRRPALVLLLAAAVTLAPLAAAPASAASPVAGVQVVLLDPLMTEPVQLEVVATDADGDGTAFSGVVTLTTGRTSVSAPVSSSGDGVGIAELDTDQLTGGSAAVRAVVHGGGRTIVSSTPRFVEVAPSLAVSGFGCAALTAAGGAVRFAVTTLNGQDVPDPASVEVDHLPYVLVPNGPTRMVDAAGRALVTSGRMSLRSGARTVATVAVPKQVRKLVFGVRWNARVRGRFVPGVYTAVLTLVDAHGRTATATRTVRLVRPGTVACL